MVQAKTELFSGELTETAKLFKVLSHPARLRILQFLSESRVCITGDISDELPLGRTTVNQHLRELKENGLIKGQVEGAKTNYCLNPEKIKKLKSIISVFLKKLEINDNKCE